MDNGRDMWNRTYGVSSHAWDGDFFVSLANSLGSFVCTDESIANKNNLDVARFMVRTLNSVILKESVKVEIDGKFYCILVRDDT